MNIEGWLSFTFNSFLDESSNLKSFDYRYTCDRATFKDRVNSWIEFFVFFHPSSEIYVRSNHLVT